MVEGRASALANPRTSLFEWTPLVGEEYSNIVYPYTRTRVSFGEAAVHRVSGGTWYANAYTGAQDRRIAPTQSFDSMEKAQRAGEQMLLSVAPDLWLLAQEARPNPRHGRKEPVLPLRRGWEEILHRLQRQPRFILTLGTKQMAITPNTHRWKPDPRKREMKTEDGFNVGEYGKNKAGFYALVESHGWYNDINEAYDVAEAALTDIERLSLEAHARENPLTERVFTPSYPAESQAEYDRRVKEGSKRSKHKQVRGGRRTVRYGEHAPEMGAGTGRRLEDRSPPWEARTQSPKVWVQTLARMGFPIPEAELQRARKNPRVPASYPARGAKPKERKLAAQIAEGFARYRASRPEGQLGLYVPRFVGPLLDAGVPEKPAHILVRRAADRFYSAAPFLEKAAAASTFGELFVEHFQASPEVRFGDGHRIEVRGVRGYIDGLSVKIGSRKPVEVLTAARINRMFDTFRKGLGTDYRSDLDDPKFAVAFLDYVDRRSRDLSRGARNEKRTFILSFTGSKKPVKLTFSPLQHSVGSASADRLLPVRYRTLENVPLVVLPSLLARLALRSSREGRRLLPLPTFESLENPMSYWEEQYSQSPFGASSSIPAARRNRGRPRKKGRTKAAAPAGSDVWVRKTKAQLERSSSPKAKAELRRRARVRGASTTRTAAKKRAPAKGKKKAVTTAVRKMKPGAWARFSKRAAAAGYTRAQTSSKWKQYKAGKGTIAALLAPKGKKKAAAPARRPAAKKKAPARTAAKKKTTTTARKPGTTWSKFRGHAAKRGYTAKQASAKWKSYKAGKGTIADLLPAKAKKTVAAKKPRAAAKKKAPARRTASRASGRRVAAKKPRAQRSRKGLNRYQLWLKAQPTGVYSRDQLRALWAQEKSAYLNPRRDLTHTRSALVPSDDWAFENGHGGDPWHPVYEQMIGQFGARSSQPVNRRNPKRKPAKRKAAGGRRKLSEYQRFCKKHMRAGKSMAQCAGMWRRR
jgi:hypothetical protein